MWRSLVLCDGTMVTGDSGGNVQFWDAQLGTRTAAFQACSLLLCRTPLYITAPSCPAHKHPASAAEVLRNSRKKLALASAQYSPLPAVGVLMQVSFCCCITEDARSSSLNADLIYVVEQCGLTPAGACG